MLPPTRGRRSPARRARCGGGASVVATTPRTAPGRRRRPSPRMRTSPRAARRLGHHPPGVRCARAWPRSWRPRQPPRLAGRASGRATGRPPGRHRATRSLRGRPQTHQFRPRDQAQATAPPRSARASDWSRRPGSHRRQSSPPESRRQDQGGRKSRRPQSSRPEGRRPSWHPPESLRPESFCPEPRLPEARRPTPLHRRNRPHRDLTGSDRDGPGRAPTGRPHRRALPARAATRGSPTAHAS